MFAMHVIYRNLTETELLKILSPSVSRLTIPCESSEIFTENVFPAQGYVS